MSRRISVLLGITSLALAPPASAHAEGGRRVVNRVAAIVDDAIITQRDVERRLAVAAHTIPAVPTGDAAAREREAKIAALRAAVLDELIDAELIADEADRRRVPVERSDVDLALSEIAKGNGLTVPQVLAEAARIGMNEAEYRAELTRQLLALRTAQLWMADETTRGELSAAASTDLDAGRKRMLTALRQRAYVEVRK